MTSPAASPTVPVTAPGETNDALLITHRPTPWEMVRDGWSHRALVPRIGIRMIVKGVAGTKLGRGWLGLRPMISIFGMALLFGAVLDTPSHGLPYLVFLLVGSHAWMTFERSAFWGVRSFDSYRRYARTFSFPLILVPTAGLVPAAIEWLVIGAIAVGTLVVFSVLDGNLYLELGPNLLAMVAGYALALGVGYVIGGLCLAPLNARARDVRIVFRILLQPWMFVTPVVYPVEELPANLRFIATINPVAAPVELVRWGAFGVGEVQLAAVAVSLGTVLVLGAAGLWYFTRVAPDLLSRQPKVGEDGDEDDDDERR